MIDVSLIIVSWNAREYLLACLDSISKTVENCSYEVIVVDNDSSDGSPDAVEEFHPDVHLIRTGENLGFARGNNIGIRESRGRYLCLVNSDVVLLPECVDRLHTFMEADTSIGLAGPRILNADGSLQPSCRRFPTLFRTLCSALGLSTLLPNSRFFGSTFMTWWKHDDQRIVDVVSGCFMFLRREAMDRVGLLDEDFFMYGEDIDWCKRFHMGREPVVFIPDAQAIHHGGASSSNQPISFFLVMQQARLIYWKKHHGIISRIVLLGIMLLHHISRAAGRGILVVVGHGDRQANVFKMRRSYTAMKWLFFRTTPTRHQDLGLDQHSQFGVKT